MCEPNPTRQLTYFWSKSYSAKPYDNIQSHHFQYGKQFVPSYEKPCAPPPNMFHLLGWQYYRVWRNEVNEFILKRNESAVKRFIKPDINHNKRRFAAMRKKKQSEKNVKEFGTAKGG